MTGDLGTEKLIDVSDDLGSLRNDLKGLYIALENNWDRELEDLLSKQGNQELGPKYHLKYRKNGIARIDGFKTAEDLVDFYNDELKNSSGLDTRFITGRARKGKVNDLAREFEAIGSRTAVVRGNSWAVDVYRTLSKSDEKSREKARRAARESLEGINFRDFVKPWKEPKYSELRGIVAGFKNDYWETYEENSVKTLETVVLQSVAEAFNPDKPAKMSFYRNLIENYESQTGSELVTSGYLVSKG